MFESNILETNSLNFHGLDLSQGAIATSPYFGEEILSTQQTQLLGPEFLDDLQLESRQFLEEVDMKTNLFSTSSEADPLTGYIGPQPVANNLTAQPDLIISDLSVPGTIEPGQSTQINYTITNQGNADADSSGYLIASKTKFFLSTDTTLDATDIYLTEDVNYDSRLAAGQSSSPSTYSLPSFTLDSNLASGTYYLLAQADGNQEMVESNENNNITYQQITVGEAQLVDLAISNISVAAPLTAGFYADFSYTVNNYGNIALGRFSGIDVTVYLSTDATLDSSDQKLTSNYSVGPLEVGGSLTLSNQVYFDVMQSGTYYLFLEADHLDLIDESNENNNIASVTIEINPSLDGYSILSGYGLIDAAAAVARAVNQPTFADVPNLGGDYWGADLVNAPEAWNAGYTGEGVVVAVLDTGVDRYHNDLKDNIWTNAGEIAGNGIDDDGNGYIDDVHGWNFDSNNNDTLDVRGHGTHVAGTIAGGDNGFGVTGIAYNAQIMPVKVLGDDGTGSDDSVLAGIRYAIDNGARVINASFGSSAWNAALLQDFYETEYGAALEYASDKGVIVVMSAGNDGASWVANYPAALARNRGLAVGAVDRDNEMASFSNRSGDRLGEDTLAYVLAPGVDVLSTTPNNSYETNSGTSMAAPHVAGVVALMLEANPNLTEAQVRDIVTSTAGNTQFT